VQRRAPLAIVAGAVVAVLIVSLVVAHFIRDRKDEATPATAAAATATQPVILRDEFTRTTAGRLHASGGPAWKALSGTWGVRDGAAFVDPSSAKPSMAVVDAHSPDVTVTVTAPRVTAGWGLVFRMAGKSDYWSVSAIPESATYTVTKVAGGESKAMGTLGLAPIGPGTTLAVRTRGPLIEIRVDGKLLRALVDDYIGAATKVGLVDTDGTGARWDHFVVRRNPGKPVGG
jgi:hypothetical protein